MKSVCVIFVIFAATGVYCDKMADTINACIDTSQVKPEEAMGVFGKGEVIEKPEDVSPAGKVFIYCIYTGMEFVNADKKFDMEKFSKSVGSEQVVTEDAIEQYPFMAEDINNAEEATVFHFKLMEIGKNQ